MVKKLTPFFRCVPQTSAAEKTPVENSKDDNDGGCNMPFFMLLYFPFLSFNDKYIMGWRKSGKEALLGEFG